MIGAEQIVVAAEDKAEGNENHTTLYLGAYYDFGVAKIMAGYQRGWNLERIGCLQSVKFNDTKAAVKTSMPISTCWVQQFLPARGLYV